MPSLSQVQSPVLQLLEEILEKYTFLKNMKTEVNKINVEFEDELF